MINRFITTVLVWTALGASAVNHSAAEAPPLRSAARPYAAVVVKLEDADTFQEQRGATKPVKDRLAGIDAPETDQPGGAEATKFAAGKILGKHVTIVVTGKDKYGRPLVEVFEPTGKSLNLDLVEHGHAWAATQYPGGKKYIAAEAKARVDGLGLWGAKDEPVAPWDWRKQRKAKGLEQ